MDLSSSVRHCGGCALDCTAQGSVASCVGGACQSTTPCSAGLTNCNGACVDTQSDPTNCGQCGVHCQYCVDGACQPCPAGEAICVEPDYPVYHSSGCRDLSTDSLHCGSCNNSCTLCDAGACVSPVSLGSGTDFAIDELYVYLAQPTEILRVPIGGGSPSVVASTLGLPTAIAVDESQVYWTLKTDGQIRSAPKTGGASSLVVSAPGPELLAVGAARVTWTSATGVFEAPKGGGGTPLLRLAQQARFLSRNSQTTYAYVPSLSNFADPGLNGHARAFALGDDGSAAAPQLICFEQDQPIPMPPSLMSATVTSLVAYEDHLASACASTTGFNYQAMSFSFGSWSVNKFYPRTLGPTNVVADDGVYAYYQVSDAYPSLRLYRKPLCASDTSLGEPIVNPNGLVSKLLVDDTYVYYSTSAGNVFAVPK